MLKNQGVTALVTLAPSAKEVSDWYVGKSLEDAQSKCLKYDPSLMASDSPTGGKTGFH